MTCHNCGCALFPGDTAWEQKRKRIGVKGTKVHVHDVTVLVCDECANP